MAIEGSKPANNASSTTISPHIARVSLGINRLFMNFNKMNDFIRLQEVSGKSKLLHKLTANLSYPARL